MQEAGDQQSEKAAELLQPPRVSPWMTRILWAIGIYNIFWGLLVVCWPDQVLQWSGLGSMAYPEVWQYVGVLTGLYGIAYVLVAKSPFENWLVVLIGLLTKLIGPVGFVSSALQGRLPWRFGWTVLGNSVIWCVPLGIILWRAYQYFVFSYQFQSPEIQEFALRVRTNRGISLLEMSRRQPLMLVFLRHLGCPFCRHSLAMLRQQYAQLQASGTGVVLIHMGNDRQTEKILARFGLADLPRVSDPQRALYRAFGLRAGNAWQVFGPQLWWGALRNTIHHGQSLMPEGNVMQMPGVFLIYYGHVVRSFLYHDIGNKPNFALLAYSQHSRSPETAV
jgi:peroxiredoxin